MSLIEKDRPEASQSASTGMTRILRFGYADQILYSRLAWRAKQLWREIEHESDQTLLLEAGVTWLATQDGGYESKSEQTLKRLSIPVERISGASLSRLFPEPIHGDDLQFGIREPTAGILRARHAVHTLTELAVGHGAEIRYETVHPHDIAEVIDTHTRSKDVALWSCGAWLGSLFPGVVPVTATHQSEIFFASDPSWQLPPMGAWIDNAAGIYGIGDLEGSGVKVSWDHIGPEVTPDNTSSAPSYEHEVREYLNRRFPILGGASIREVTSCHYEMAPNADFVIARHPAMSNSWIVGGGSGHGFKHGPAIAEYVWSLVNRNLNPDPRFGLVRGNRKPG